MCKTSPGQVLHVIRHCIMCNMSPGQIIMCNTSPDQSIVCNTSSDHGIMCNTSPDHGIMCHTSPDWSIMCTTSPDHSACDDNGSLVFVTRADVGAQCTEVFFKRSDYLIFQCNSQRYLVYIG